MVQQNRYDERYSGDELYWGTEPSSICERLLEHLKPDETNHPTLIDLGCGEGRNSIHLAKEGFQVTAIDLSPPAIDKTVRMAATAGVEIQAKVADICSCQLERQFDVVFSTGTVHYIPPEQRVARFEYFKQQTTPGGLHAITALVQKPFIATAPDHQAGVTLFKSGELLGYYWDWEILFSIESIFDCNSGGVPHRHASNRIVARRV